MCCIFSVCLTAFVGTILVACLFVCLFVGQFDRLSDCWLCACVCGGPNQMNQTLNCFDIFYNLFIATFCHSSPSTIVFDKTFGRKSYFIFSFQFKFKFELELQMLPFHGFDYDLHLQCLLCVCMCGAVLFRYSTFAHSMCHFMPHFYISSNYYWTFRNANEHHLGWL